VIWDWLLPRSRLEAEPLPVSESALRCGRQPLWFT
jgi:hypothetical protein